MGKPQPKRKTATSKPPARKQTAASSARPSTASRGSVRLDFEALQEAADCLRILAHPQRLQIVQLLLAEKSCSVGEIATACGLAQPTTSLHLRLMHRCGFLSSERSGRSVSYAVNEPHLKELMKCIEKRFGGQRT